MKKATGIRALPSDAVYGQEDSPVGKLTIVASSAGLHAIFWDCDLKKPEYAQTLSGLKRSQENRIIKKTKSQLREYFAGKRKSFDLPLALNGTPFQMQVWRQLAKIPYAKTISYGEQAAKIGDRKKARAVGLANGQNPICIVLPCHRVIGSNGDLTGFGGGLDKKAFLLKLEQQFQL